MEKSTAKAELKLPELPKLVMPKFDLDAWIALQKANVETVIAAQKIFFDLFQTVSKRQAELFKEMVGKVEGSVKGGFDSKKQPAAYVDEAKAAIEKAMADAKETMDLGLKAQAEVVDLLVKRATANFDQVKSLAA
ncbi:MAG TPA: phasin family protein [Geminicoccaceae bacterium]|nr:phasin family protein [Geminicoccus sp.]HMU50981.1 phasin family protein [Geminicoccaceae bacterium]